jgi:hypothetical protein
MFLYPSKRPRYKTIDKTDKIVLCTTTFQFWKIYRTITVFYWNNKQIFTGFTWCGYEVAGTILLGVLKTAIRFDLSKNMSACVSTCIRYDFNALTLVMWKMWRSYNVVFLHPVAKMSDQIFEQRINIKFCVKLREKATDTCAVLSEAYGGETLIKSSVSEYHKRFKESSHVEITNEGNAHHFLRYQGYCSL